MDSPPEMLVEQTFDMLKIPYKWNCHWREIFVFGLVILTGCQKLESIPGVVQGGSMAPNLLGPHQKLNCRDCQFPILFQLNAGDSATRMIVCPNCGFAENQVSESVEQPAQRVVIRPEPGISRWDVVAFQLPDSKSVGIKRIVGMPNEKIEIMNGNLFLHGSPMVKPWNIQKQIRIPVYDSAFKPGLTQIADRWQPAFEKTDWVKKRTTWLFKKTKGFEMGDPDNSGFQAPQGQWDWLNYRHWRCCAHTGTRTDLFPIEDIDYFNPSQSRQLNTSVDMFFEIEGQLSANGELAWRCFRGGQLIEFTINASDRRLVIRRIADIKGELVIIMGPDLNFDLTSDHINEDGQFCIELSTFDNWLTLYLNGHFALSEELHPVNDVIVPAEIIQIGGKRGSIELHRVRIWRDVYYLPGATNTLQLPANSYLLLGDNVPVSIDSRHWNRAGIQRKQIYGIVETGVID